MRLSLALLAALAAVETRSLQLHFKNEESPFTVADYDAAEIARTLVQKESLMNVNTIQPDGYPVSFMEYYADCDNDGNPYWLAIDISTTYRNILTGSPVSFSIRADDHPMAEKVSNEYPGGVKGSPAGSPRVSVRADMQEISGSAGKKLEECFLKRHPDATWWLPGSNNSPHSSRWIKLIIKEVYFIGGFGDRAFIGPIDAQAYHEVNITA